MKDLKIKLEQKMKDNPFLTCSRILTDCLREEIIDLNIRPGEKINESQLAKELNISRSPVKMAIDTLLEEGFMIRTKKKGVVISPLSMRDYLKIMDARIALESQAAYIAAKTITKEELEKLKTVLKQFQEAKNKRDHILWEICDDNFHRIIIDAARNEYMAEMYQLIYPKMRRYRRYLTRVYCSQDDSVEREFPSHHHIAIYNAISQHYSRIAEEEMVKDITRMTKGINFVIPIFQVQF